jgi:hypothetical protein
MPVSVAQLKAAALAAAVVLIAMHFLKPVRDFANGV